MTIVWDLFIIFVCKIIKGRYNPLIIYVTLNLSVVYSLHLRQKV